MAPIRLGVFAVLLLFALSAGAEHHGGHHHGNKAESGLRESHRSDPALEPGAAPHPQAGHHLEQPVNEEQLVAERHKYHAGDHSLQGAEAGRDTKHAHAPNQIGFTPPSTSKVSLSLLLVMTMVMAMLSGVGAMPYLFTGKLNPYWSGIANAVGCGVMLAASFDLLEESKPYSPHLVIGGIVLGIIAMKLSEEYLDQYEDVSFSDLQGADARKAVLVLGVMAAHAFGEGSGVGVSFSGPRGWAQGLLVTIAIGLHNIPEGMAVATVMVARGTPPKKALYWTLLSSLPQGIVAVPAYMFVETFSGVLPVALGFAAGCMIYIVFAELIPDALESAEHSHVATAATLSAAWLQWISMSISQLERPDGSMASPIKADLPTVLPDLALLVPMLFVPCAAAAVGSMAMQSVPLAVGAAAGVTAWLGVSGLAWAAYHLPACHLCLALCGGAGALCAAFGWRVCLSFAAAGPKESGHGHSLKRHSSGALPDEAGCGADGAGAGAHAAYLNGGAGMSPPPKLLGLSSAQAGGASPHWGVNSSTTYSQAGSSLQQRWGRPVTGSSGEGFISLELPAGGGGGGGGGNGGPMAVAGQPYGLGEALGGVPGGAANGHAHAHGGRCNCNKGSGCNSPPPDAAHEAAYRSTSHPSGAGGAGSLLGGLEAQLSNWAPVNGVAAFSSHRDYKQAALFSLACLVLYSLPCAMRVAGAVAANAGDVSHLLLPLLLSGVPLGVALVGLGSAFAGPGWQAPQALAVVCSFLSACALATAVLGHPIGVAPQQKYDPDHTTEKVMAFGSGAMLLVSIGYLWPAAVHAKPRKAQAGLALGLGVAIVTSLLHGALCLGTPYCLA